MLICLFFCKITTVSALWIYTDYRFNYHIHLSGIKALRDRRLLRNFVIMKKELLDVKSVPEYNEMLGVDTVHPLISVIDLSKAKQMRHMRHTFGFYAIFLKDVEGCELVYGRQKYDYQKGTVVCLAPGQVIGLEDTGKVFQPKGYALCFDPDLIRGTALGRNIKDYTFFSYAVNEALHLSDKERVTFLSCLDNIAAELGHDIDRMSRRLLVNNIELLLNYCMRFYERQFITRELST